MNAGATATVVAVAGRRVDAPGATPERFPPSQCDRVRDAIAAALGARRVSVLVASAACGVDLLALDAAAALGIRRRIILPFPAERFREGSVVDRPGPWGPLFDRLVADAARAGDLIVLNGGEGEDAYERTNLAILTEGEMLAEAAGAATMALVAWEGMSRGAGDLTAQFRSAAMSRGWTVEEIRTR